MTAGVLASMHIPVYMAPIESILPCLIILQFSLSAGSHDVSVLFVELKLYSDWIVFIQIHVVMHVERGWVTQ